MKKLLSILLCFMLSVSLFTAPSFAAETETDSYQAQLKAAVDLGLLEMNALGRAGKTMSRGEFFNALSILAGADVMTDAPVPFTDIDQKSPYFNGICAVHALGFVGGYGDGTVHPDEPIIMNQAVRLLSYVIGYKDMLDAGYPLTRFVRESNLCGYDVCSLSTHIIIVLCAYKSNHILPLLSLL